MNDLTPQERDELVSAYLDGEATAQERAMVEADSDLLARAEQFRHAAEEIASPVAETGREEIIAHALESAEAEAKPSKLRVWIAQSRQKIRSLRIPPGLRDRLRNRRLVPIFGVAAALAVVFLAIAVFAVWSEDTGDDSDIALSTTTTQTVESMLESEEFRAAFDEVFGIPATTAAAAMTAAQSAAMSAPEEAIEEQSDLDEPPLAEAAAFQDLGADGLPDLFDESGPPAGPPAPPQMQLDAPDSGLDGGADADLAENSPGPSTGECPTTEEAVEENPETAIEGELEDTEEFSPDGPPSVERPDPESPDRSPAEALPDTSLDVPEPPSDIPSPPPEDASSRSSSGSSGLIIDGPEDAPLVECP